MKKAYQFWVVVIAALLSIGLTYLSPKTFADKPRAATMKIAVQSNVPQSQAKTESIRFENMACTHVITTQSMVGIHFTCLRLYEGE